MVTSDTQPDINHEPLLDPTNNKIKSKLSKKGLPIVGLVKRWATEHTSEIVWAFVFAVLIGYAFALYLQEPKPYKIYVVADAGTDTETLLQNFYSEEKKGTITQIGGVPVQVHVELLADNDKDTAKSKAEELVGRPDTLLVIEHGRSEHVAYSLPTYLGARPQVPVLATVATADNLLTECKETESICFDSISPDPILPGVPRFVPLLQLSPTNEVQGRSAVQFAVQENKRHFLVVTSTNPIDQAYTADMAKAYSVAIRAAGAEEVLVRKMDPLPSQAEVINAKPDCILYAGDVGQARTLFTWLSGMKLTKTDLVVILSDSVIESRGTDSNLAVFTPIGQGNTEFPTNTHPLIELAGSREALPHGSRVSPSSPHKIPVNFTYQSDAMDYNKHSNAYAKDAVAIALQLINDLNERGGDLRFRVKSLLHLYNVNDARRNLVNIMQQNSRFRTSYTSASPGRPYVFEGYKQYGGMFHVWRLRPSPEPGSEMDDVDNWHPPRMVASH